MTISEQKEMHDELKRLVESHELITSRQAEIDELNFKLAEMKSRLNDAYTDGQTSMYKTKQAEIDELRTRIDRVVHILTYTNHASTPLCNELRDILKGE